MVLRPRGADVSQRFFLGALKCLEELEVKFSLKYS